MSRFTPRSDSGIALAMAMVIVILIAGLGVALASFSLTHNAKAEMTNEALEAEYTANAALEDIATRIRLSEKDSGGNLFLNFYAVPAPADISEPGPGDTPLFLLKIKPSSSAVKPHVYAEVFIYSIDSFARTFRILARATAHGRTVIVAQDYWAWNTFARYAMFADQAPLSFGLTQVDGHVHSNQSVNFLEGGSKFSNYVTAHQGFNYSGSATIGNTQIAFPNVSADVVTMPSTGQFSDMRIHSSGEFDVHSTNPLYNSATPVDAAIVFDGDEVTITASSNGNVISTVTKQILPNEPNLIFVEGNVTSVQGDLNSRVSIAAMGQITVTGNIRYVDQSGRSAYQVTQNGNPVNPATLPPSATYGSGGIQYGVNPDFAPTAGTLPPTLGLMAVGDIVLSSQAPYNLEVNASLFSLTGSWHADVDPATGTQKGNLRIVGSIATSQGGYRMASPLGFTKSGGYLYDTALQTSPPPFYIKQDVITCGPRFKTKQS